MFARKIMKFMLSLLLVLSVTGGQPAAAHIVQTGKTPDVTHTSRCGNPADTGRVSAPLMVAIWQGNLDAVNNLLFAGTKLNVLLPEDCATSGKKPMTTPLIYAIQAKQGSRFHARSQGMVGFLLQQGADANFHPAQAMTPLQVAASLGDASSVRTLLVNGACADDRDEKGDTALLIAAQQSNGAAVIQQLVDSGANLHAMNNSGDNAVMLAAQQHQLDNVKLLVGLEVDACAKDHDGKTAADLAQLNTKDDPAKQEILALLKTKCGS
jgi:ankyrin repeat protein